MERDAGSWADELRAAMQRAGISEQQQLADVLQVTDATVSRWLNGHAAPQNRKKRDEVLAKLRVPTRPSVAHHAPVAPRTFATDAERHAYTLGVLDVAQVSVGEASRAISSASAALLAPLTQIAAAYPDTPETRARRAAASAASDAQPPGQAAAQSPRPARRKA